MNHKFTFDEKLFLIRILVYTIITGYLSSQYTVPFFKFIIYLYTEAFLQIWYPDLKTEMFYPKD